MAVGQHTGMLDKIRNLIKAVKYQHKGISLLIKRAQQMRQLRPGLDVKAVERFVEDQQLRLAHQRLAKQGFPRFAGRKIFEASVEQGGNAELFSQALTAGRIFHLILDNFRRCTAGIFFSRTE